MPIVKDGDGVCIEYTIPRDIKKLITDDFLKEFRNQLFRIHEDYSLETFADYGIPMNTSTAGWHAAFGKACLLTHKEELLDYHRTLDWYDSDIFDSDLTEMLIDRKFILGDSAEIIGKQLNINSDDIVCCYNCGRFYTKDMVVIVTEDDEDYYDYGVQYRCFNCQDMKDRTNKEYNTTDYYRNILKELDEYNKTHPLKRGF